MNWLAVKLSDHFWLREFRCRGRSCCCHGAVQVSDELVTILEEIRGTVGGTPIKINSAFRCDDHNAKVGGHPRSYHRIGEAADVTNFELRKDLEGWAVKIGAIVEAWLGADRGNVIYYPNNGFIHVDVGDRVGSAGIVRKKESRTQGVPDDAV